MIFLCLKKCLNGCVFPYHPYVLLTVSLCLQSSTWNETKSCSWGSFTWSYTPRYAVNAILLQTSKLAWYVGGIQGVNFKEDVDCPTAILVPGLWTHSRRFSQEMVLTVKQYFTLKTILLFLLLQLRMIFFWQAGSHITTQRGFIVCMWDNRTMEDIKHNDAVHNIIIKKISWKVKTETLFSVNAAVSSY